VKKRQISLEPQKAKENTDGKCMVPGCFLPLPLKAPFFGGRAKDH